MSRDARSSVYIDDVSRSVTPSPEERAASGFVLLAAASWLFFVETGGQASGVASAIRALAAFSAACGAAALGHGVFAMRRRSAFEAALDAGSPDAWLLDREWTPGESRDGAFVRGLWSVFTLSLALGIVGFFCAATLVLGEWRLDGLSAFGLFFAAVMTGLFLTMTDYVRDVRHLLRRGESVLRWDGPSPVPPGADWSGVAEVRGTLEEPRARLRLVEETYVQTANGRRARRLERAGVDAAVFAEPALTPGVTRLRIAARVPRSLLTSTWTRHPARYWEVAVRAKGLRTAFPLPVYR